MSLYVFLGPSLPVERARAILPDAVYLPPVSMGDVFALMGRAPQTIAIIDGIFEMYRSGVLEDDDEVAIVHAPAELAHRPLSDAMVNLRDGLRQAEAALVIGPATHAALVQAAKELFYPDRTWARLFDLGMALGVPTHELAALRELVARVAPDLKRADAVELLEGLAADSGLARRPPTPAFDFEPTSSWLEMTRIETERRARGTGG